MTQVIERQTFQAQDFSATSFAQATIVDCIFENCNFTSVNFQQAKLTDCTFRSCNLSLINLDGCYLQDVTFDECKLTGTDFFKCEKIFFSITLKNSYLQYCNFSRLPMSKISFIESKLLECRFNETILIEANFTGCDLTETTFHRCDLTRADFTGAVNYSIDIRTNAVKLAKFSLPEAVRLLHGFDIIIQ